MDLVSELESIRKLSGLDFGLLLTGHGAHLHVQTAECVRELRLHCQYTVRDREKPVYSG